jgi:arylsulfatase A-like enzyme
VLFQGDTFRADNLAAHGGDPAIAPQLNEFARASVRFAEARSTSSWTLPAHVSMFAGLLPHQARVTTLNDRLGEEAVTLAEVLQAAGYRTGAISDGAFVTPAFGLGQGFEVFDARLKSPEQTLAAVRAFLELDDGRPLFLFVQSYRAHHPYKPDPEAAPETLRALGLRADLDLAEFAERAPSIADWHPGWTPAPAEAQRMRDYEALYRTASHALDRLFGATRALLAERAETVLVFTSDHGEAFWEHGVAEHGNGVWGELVRIPLLVSAPGLAPGVRAQPASLLDLPRTLCALAGVAPAPQWGGVDLFSATDERTLFAFECDLRGGASSLALITDGKTLIASDPPESEPALEAAFDLAQDPLERADRSHDPWAPQLFEALRAELAAARRPHLAGTASAPDADVLGDLQQLGYTGD